MLKIEYSTRFKRDYKRMLKRNCDSKELEEVLEFLIRQKPLPKNYLDHPLSGNYKGFRECHINPDWLLIYRIDKKMLVLVLARTGSHSELFGK